MGGAGRDVAYGRFLIKLNSMRAFVLMGSDYSSRICKNLEE
jgi:hypothetical protein